MEDHIGRMLGSYQIVEQIGMGGMATVYKAYQPSMDRFVAIKVLPRNLTQDASFVGRFTQEARTLARLEHPHILPVHDYGEQEGTTYLVMRYVEAGTLKDLIARAGEIDLVDAARIFSEVGGALEYAHSQGVIHRDMKPSNVLIDERGNTFLTDFGIAKLVAETAEFTASGAIIGTPAYMSPEQGMGRPADHRSDIYSLGVMLYEMVTGQVPFEAETPLAVMLKQINDPLPLPRQFRPGIPEGVERVIMKATAKEPADRYQHAQQMVDALHDAVAGGTGAVPVPAADEADGATFVLPGAADGPPVDTWTPMDAEAATPAAPDAKPSFAPAPVQPTPVPEPTLPPRATGGAEPSLQTAEPDRRRLPWLPIAAGVVIVALLIIAGLVIVPNLIDGEPEPTAAGALVEGTPSVEQTAAPRQAATEGPPAGTGQAQETEPAVQTQPSPAAATAVLGSLEPGAGWTNYGNPNFVLSLARDGDALWAGSESGLLRWDLKDGSHIAYGLADGLASSHIEDLVIGDAGDLWIATDAGITRFDGETMTIYDEADGLDSSQVQALYLDDAGGLWAGSRGGERGLNYYDGERWGAPPIPPLPVDYRAVLALDGDGEQDLFVGLEDQGLAHFDGQEWQVWTVEDGLPEGELLDILITEDSVWASFDAAVAQLDRETGAIETIPQDNVQAMHQAADGSLWFGGIGHALRFEPDSGDWKEFESAPGPIPSWMVTSIAEDEGRVWLGTYGGGLAAYDGAGWETWATEADLGGNYIEAIRQGSDGVLWFSHPGSGLTRHDPASGSWQVFGYDEGTTDWPAVPDVDSDGNLWTGEWEALTEYNGQAWQTIALPQLADTGIFAVEVDRSDRLWLVTDQGLQRYDPAAGDLVAFASADLPAIGELWSMRATSDGALWAGGEAGLARYDDAGWGTPEVAGDAPRYVSGIAEAPDGSLWVAADGELAHLRDGSWDFYAWPSDGWLEHVATGPDGVVWAGYEGLGRYDPSSDEWQIYSTDDGLAHHLVTTIHVTPEGVVWVGTEGGVSRFAPPDAPR